MLLSVAGCHTFFRNHMYKHLPNAFVPNKRTNTYICTMPWVRAVSVFCRVCEPQPTRHFDTKTIKRIVLVYCRLFDFDGCYSLDQTTVLAYSGIFDFLTYGLGCGRLPRSLTPDVSLSCATIDNNTLIIKHDLCVDCPAVCALTGGRPRTYRYTHGMDSCRVCAHQHGTLRK